MKAENNRKESRDGLPQADDLTMLFVRYNG